MKKISIILILISAVLFIALPYLIGMKIQSELEDMIAVANANNSYDVEIERYDRGWLSSSGAFSAVLNIANPNNDPELAKISKLTQLGFDFDIRHGPFIQDGGFGLFNWNYHLRDSDSIKAYASWQEGTSLYKSSGQVSLRGHVHFQDSMPIISSPQSLEEQLSYVVGGYAGYGDLIDGQLTYRSSTGSLELNSSDIKIKISPIEAALQMDMDLNNMFSDQLFNNKAKLDINDIIINGDESVAISGFEIKTNMTLPSDASLADINVEYLIDSIETEPFSMNDFVFDISMENYSADFHAAYYDFAKNMDFSKDTDQSQANFQRFMEESFPLLLKSEPVFKINNLALSLPSLGELDAQAELRIDSINNLPAELGNMPFWLDKIYAYLSLSIDQPVIDYIAYNLISQKLQANATEGQEITAEEIQAAMDTQLEFGISMLSSMGIIVPTGKGYEIKAKYDHGETSVNGENFALPF